MQTGKIYLSYTIGYVHVSFPFATTTGYLHTISDKMKQTAILYKQNHLVLQWMSQVFPVVIKMSDYYELLKT